MEKKQGAWSISYWLRFADTDFDMLEKEPRKKELSKQEAEKRTLKKKVEESCNQTVAQVVAPDLPSKSKTIARIYFKDVPGTDKIEITDLENFKSAAEISVAYGSMVRSAYRMQPHRMYKSVSLSKDEISRKSFWLAQGQVSTIVGEQYSKTFFMNNIVPEARTCGVILSKIIKEYKKPKIQCIEI